MNDSLISAPALARQLGLDAKHLRALIREHELVPDHQRYARHQLDPSDVARISSHPAVRSAARR